MVDKQETVNKDELIVELQSRLDEAEETLNAIQNGEVDAIVTPQGSDGPKVYTLESADTLYRNIIQEMNEGVATLTIDSTIFYSNVQLSHMLQIPLDKIIGQKLSDFIFSDDLDKYNNILERGIQTKSSGEIRIKSLNDIIIPVYISINTLKDLKGLYVVITDLSEQKHHEELKTAHEKLNKILEALKDSEERYRNIIENILDAYIRTDKEGTIIMTSPSAARMYGFDSSQDMEGIPATLLYKNPEFRSIMLKELDIEGKLVDFQFEALRKDGTTFPGSMNAQYRYDDQSRIQGTDVFIRDITERKHAENEKQRLLEQEIMLTEELSASNEELQATTEELQTTNEELMIAQNNQRDLIKELKTSNKELEQFAYVASHDLQEPLRMVSSFTQLLNRRYKGQLDENADDYIDFIVDGVHRMKDLIDDLLAFSRLKTEAREFESVLMEISLDDALRNLKPVIKETNAQITHDPLPEIKSDAPQITQLLQNLIGNAIKFHGDKPPQIHISAEKLNNEWVFGVNDNGIGIDLKYQEQIFSIFKRLHTREEFEGTGIGLSICKRIVERHNGRIWVESEVGKGSTFYFTIPHTFPYLKKY